jgi:3-oxoacyl-[acyl-carrier-protein] synthase-3
VQAHTDERGLCQSEGHENFMRTDSEQLMLAGIETGSRTFDRFLDELEWTRADVAKTVCHQVGAAHRRMMFERLGLGDELDFATFETLGNTGAVALPLTMALAAESGRLQRGDRVAMMGIGSGINCLMLGAQWQRSLVRGDGQVTPPAVKALAATH